MSFLNIVLVLLVVYAVYYGVLILWDTVVAPKVTKEEEEEVPVFSIEDDDAGAADGPVFVDRDMLGELTGEMSQDKIDLGGSYVDAIPAEDFVAMVNNASRDDRLEELVCAFVGATIEADEAA